MSDVKFQDALAFWWRVENDGQPFHITRGDAGGATSWGVTWRRWTAWRTMHPDSGPGATMAEFIKLGREDFEPFYRSAFWNPIHGDYLPNGVGVVMFDSAGMSGVTRVSRWLQRAVGAEPDGVVGPRTMAAVAAADPRATITAITNLRRAFYNDIAQNDDNGQFLDGWLARAHRCEIAGLAAAALG